MADSSEWEALEDPPAEPDDAEFGGLDAVLEEEERGRDEHHEQQQDEASTSGNCSAREVLLGRPLTRDMVLRAVRGQARHASDLDKLMAKATHLHLNGMQLGKIGAGPMLIGLPSLQTLYIYDNLLQNLDGVSVLKHLTSIYLQNNLITSLAPLRTLARLQKVYAEGNQIEMVEGIGDLLELEELHLNNQRLPEGSPGLRFEPGCVQSLAPSLRVLSAIGCGIQDEALMDLRGLGELRKLDLSQNQLSSFELLDEVVRDAPRLLTLQLAGNPVCRNPKYREQVIVMSDSVSVLDGQPVLQQQREVLMRLQIKRMKAALVAEQAEEAAARALPAAVGAQHAGKPSSRGGSAPEQHAAAAGYGLAASTSQHHRHAPAAAPPVAAGFGAPKPGHLAHQVSGGRRSGSAAAAKAAVAAAEADLSSLGIGGVQMQAWHRGAGG